MSNDGDNRPYDPAGTRPKVDPESLRAVAPPPDLPWAEREQRAEVGLESAIGRLEEVHVEEEDGASRHIGRFQFILGGLIAVGVIAVAAIVMVIIAGRSDAPDTAWSAWHPTGDDTLQQIADHVGTQYRLESGAQLASVLGGPLEIDTGGGDKVTAQVVREDPRTQNLALEDGKTALFNLCGAGQSCTFAGKPSEDRLLYVRREALELALYALRYTDADQVVVTFPLRSADATTGQTTVVPGAVFVRRDDVKPLLDRPLRDTLATNTPALGAIQRSTGIRIVDSQLTDPYAYQLEPTSNLGALFVLSSVQSLLSSGATTTTTPQATTSTPPAATTTPQATTTTPQQKSKGKSGQRGG